MSPSGMCLDNTVDWYKFQGVNDADGTPGPGSFPPSPTVAGIACSAQLTEGVQEIHEARRVTTYFYGWIEFGDFYPMSKRDMLVWTSANETHNLFVIALTDGAGRNGVFGVQVEERA